MGPQLEDTNLRLESDCCYDDPASFPSSVGIASRVPKIGSISGRCCEQMEKLVRSVCFRNIMLGQVLSLLIAIMSMSAASLDDRGVNLPCFVNFVNYGTITLIFFIPMMVSRRGSLQLTLPWWRYAAYALVDVQANTLSVLAFRYTSITSVAMLDAFSIPAVMVLSRLLLHAQYTRKHLIGVAFCLVGLALNIISDLEGEEEGAEYPHALRGDLFCIMGAALYAGSNVMQEDFVKNHDRVEFLGMAGIFGVIISGVQMLMMESQALADIEWTQSIVLFTCGYALSLSVMYSWTSLFLQAGDAAMFNLSLLTSDVYALLFAFLVENVTPNWLYFVAFAVIFSGLVTYHSQPPPTSADPSRLELMGGDSVSVSWNGERGHGLSTSGSNNSSRDVFELPKEFVRDRSGSGRTYCGSVSSGQSPASASPFPLNRSSWQV